MERGGGGEFVAQRGEFAARRLGRRRIAPPVGVLESDGEFVEPASIGALGLVVEDGIRTVGGSGPAEQRVDVDRLARRPGS